jgi:4a-hydroxytetrahydrobiopterin dehydratase
MSRDLLDSTTLQEALQRLPGWEADGSCLRKTFQFPTYLSGIDFVSALAVEAERMNHHPDLFIGWRKVVVTLSTHSAKGITALDVELARLSDRLFPAAS